MTLTNPLPNNVDELLKVTPEMQDAWVAYEPIGQFTESMSFARFASMIRHAFMSGFAAGVSSPPRSGDEVERLRTVLGDARDAISSLDEDALGFADDGWSAWSSRDELLRNIDEALSPLPSVSRDDE